MHLAGNWGLWSSWTTCIATSGGGSQARTRLCCNPAPVYGGANCVGSGVEFQQCNNQISKMLLKARQGLVWHFISKRLSIMKSNYSLAFSEQKPMPAS